MSRSPSRTYVVAKNASGAWSVTLSGKTSKVFQTKGDAVKAARQITDGRMSKSFTLGRSAMTKLNEVEGVALTVAGKRTFKEFDKKGLTPSQRRAKLRKDPGKLTAGVKSTLPAQSQGSGAADELVRQVMFAQ